MGPVALSSLLRRATLERGVEGRRPGWRRGRTGDRQRDASVRITTALAPMAPEGEAGHI
jgi:hypothetical protein